MLHIKDIFSAILALALAAPGVAAASPSGSDGFSPERPARVQSGCAPGSVLADRILAERGSAGLQPLLEHPALQEVACAHALDMARRGYVGDVTPEGVSLLDRLRRNDRRSLYSVFGANIARVGEGADPAGIHAALMSGAEHSANILRPGFSHAAVASVTEGGRTYVVQLFARIEGQLGSDLPLSTGEPLLLAPEFVSRAMLPVSWSLTDASGNALLRGGGEKLSPARGRGVEGYLTLSVAVGTDIYELRGPSLAFN